MFCTCCTKKITWGETGPCLKGAQHQISGGWKKSEKGLRQTEKRGKVKVLGPGQGSSVVKKKKLRKPSRQITGLKNKKKTT